MYPEEEDKKEERNTKPEERKQTKETAIQKDQVQQERKENQQVAIPKQKRQGKDGEVHITQVWNRLGINPKNSLKAIQEEKYKEQNGKVEENKDKEMSTKSNVIYQQLMLK